MDAQEQLQLLTLAVMQSTDAILITDAQLEFPGPRIVFVNPAFSNNTGYSFEEAVGQTPRILQGPLTDKAVTTRLREKARCGEAFSGETINYRKDGSAFIHEWRVTPIRDSAGKITHFVAVQRDVTERRRVEMEANRLAAIVENSDDAIVGKDLNGVVQSWNRGAEKIFGYSADEMVGHSIKRLIPPDRHDEETQILARIGNGLNVPHFETVRQTKDGRFIFVSVSASPIKDSSGRVVGVSKSARDITARKMEERATQLMEGGYRTLFDCAPEGILIASAHGGYVDANPAVCRMLGYERWELTKLTARDIVIPEETPQLEPAADAIKKSEKFQSEWHLRRKDGSIFRAEVTSAKMPDGNLLAILRDVTAQRIQQEKIAEQAEFLSKARDAILVRDLEGKIIYWNEGAERIYGWKKEEAIGRNIGDFIYADPLVFTKLNAEVLQLGVWTGELHHVTKDRQKRTIEGRWSLIRDQSGKPRSILAINTDITEKKKIEAQFMRAQRMESIGTLAGGIAHDLNNILAPIMMAIPLLKRDGDSKEISGILEAIELSAKRGADIVRQVLSFARGLEGERVEIQIKHLLGDLETIIRTTFPKDVRLHFVVPSDAWTILGDPTQVHQILLNLCVNARDAMPNGGSLVVEVENCVLDEHYTAMATQTKPGRYVNITVTDSGTGISASIIDKIFEPFFTTKDINTGTGLGLSTVVAIVKSHEGIINVYSEPGKGTTFKVYLPASHASPEARREQLEQASLPRGHGEAVLIVDDEASVVSITSQTLQAFGYRVFTAIDGADGVAVYLQHRREIAVVLTDIMMPIMDGPALIHAITRMDPMVRVIAASGLHTNGEVAKISGAGIKHFLTKPYTARTLLTAIRSVLDEK